jgi:hypothetical protein
VRGAEGALGRSLTCEAACADGSPPNAAACVQNVVLEVSSPPRPTAAAVDGGDAQGSPQVREHVPRSQCPRGLCTIDLVLVGVPYPRPPPFAQRQSQPRRSMRDRTPAHVAPVAAAAAATPGAVATGSTPAAAPAPGRAARSLSSPHRSPPRRQSLGMGGGGAASAAPSPYAAVAHTAAPPPPSTSAASSAGNPHQRRASGGGKVSPRVPTSSSSSGGGRHGDP